jgi:hypothetical protein
MVNKITMFVFKQPWLEEKTRFLYISSRCPARNFEVQHRQRLAADLKGAIPFATLVTPRFTPQPFRQLVNI